MKIQFRRTTVMRKMKKKFIALLVVFTSIISFLPVGFNGQAAKADVVTDASTVRINVDGSSTPLTTRTDSTITDATIYTVPDPQSAFDITVKDVSKTTNEWITDSQTQKAPLTGVIGQKVILVSLNDVNLVGTDGVSPNQAGYDLIKGMGINVSGNEVVGGALQNDDALNTISTDQNNTMIGPQQTDGINE
jgi:hypothetical protein